MKNLQKFDEERQEKKSRREKELEDFLQLRRQRTADDIVKTYNKPERSTPDFDFFKTRDAPT